MKKLSREEFLELYSKYESWIDSQAGQQDAYTYEKTFDEFVQDMNQELFRRTNEATSEVSERKKKVTSRFGKLSVNTCNPLAPSQKKGFRISPYLQELACLVGQRVPFEEASELLATLCGVKLSSKTIERLCHYYGESLEITLNEPPTSVKKNSEAHYVMLDGSMLLTREEKWKEIKLGRIFKAEDNIAIKKRRGIRDSVYVAHLGTHTDFLQKVENQIDSLSNITVVADGAPWIWNYFEEYRPDAVQILDYYHAVEKLSSFAKQYFQHETTACAWIALQKDHLLEDNVDFVIASIDKMACKGKAQSEKKALLGYYRRNKKRMKYQTFQEKGLLIGSGAIESAHREVLQKRLKLSGQRWTKKGLQQVANLRVAKLSNKWDNVLNQIKAAA
jgi:hypothetical protein